MKIDGTEIANEILEELRLKVEKLREKNIFPNLAIILLGEDPASKAYVNQKKIKAELIKAKTTIFNLESKIRNSELEELIDKLNKDSSIHGIIIQQPLPSDINIKQITKAIDPKKDVDGFHPKSKFQSPISSAVLKILKQIHYNSPRRSPFGHLRGGVAPAAHLEDEFLKWLNSKKIVVLGKGETGGKPIIENLKKNGINPTIIDSKTKNPQSLTKTADIIISAVGKPNIIKPNMIKKGVILISVGLHKGTDGKLHGDYNEEEIKNIASFYTPTPGGIGPVNVAMLLENLIKSSENFSR